MDDDDSIERDLREHAELSARYIDALEDPAVRSALEELGAEAQAYAHLLMRRYNFTSAQAVSATAAAAVAALLTD